MNSFAKLVYKMKSKKMHSIDTYEAYTCKAIQCNCLIWGKNTQKLHTE